MKSVNGLKKVSNVLVIKPAGKRDEINLCLNLNCVESFFVKKQQGTKNKNKNRGKNHGKGKITCTVYIVVQVIFQYSVKESRAIKT